MFKEKEVKNTMKNEEKKIKIVYAEPEDYFPKEIREKYKLGEFAEPEQEDTEAKEEYLVNCGGIQPDDILSDDGHKG